MTWTHIKPSRELMLTEQWIFRTPKENVPACSLKGTELPGHWQANILNRNGISTVPHFIVATSVEEAQQACEVRLENLGWRTT